MSCSTTTIVRSAREVEDQLGGLLGLAVGHAGDRLVEQQQSAVVDQQHADLEPLLLAVARARRPACAALLGKTDAGQGRASMRSRRCGVSRANSVARCRGCSASASSRFSKTVRFSNTVGRWNLRPDAEIGDRGLVEAGQIRRCRRRKPRPDPAGSCR